MMDSGRSAVFFENASSSTRKKLLRPSCWARTMPTISRTATQANFVHCVKPPCNSVWKLRTGASGLPSLTIRSRTSLIFMTRLTITLRSFGLLLKTTSRVLVSPATWRLQADGMPVRGRLCSAGCHSLKVTLWARSATSCSLQYLNANYWVISTAPLCPTISPHRCSNAAVQSSSGHLSTRLFRPARRAPCNSRWPIGRLHD
mmetsp:Transcript_29795/g.57623  ORF Transcript_29795/g.57623 Transcript_29795/m.57623 type:complete len:202 (+) Transcript_29795:291-896(+)